MTTVAFDAFMNFWLTINNLLKGRGQPEMLFGEARDYWNEYRAR